MLVGSLAETAWGDGMLLCDGIKNDATRALLSEPSGRGTLTRFQRCWRYGAAFDVWPWSLKRRGTEGP